MDDFLAKPIKKDLLIAMLDNYLQRQEQAQQVTDFSSLQSSRGEPFRLLVVEDNLVNQKVAVRSLANLGLEADVAGNGLEAVAAVADREYDLLLMDCQMPELDGYGATAQIRAAEKEGQRLPIIAMTAHASKAERQKCLDAGMDDFVSKPISKDKLLALLNRELL